GQDDRTPERAQRIERRPWRAREWCASESLQANSVGESTAGSRRELAGQPELTYSPVNRSQAVNPHSRSPAGRKSGTQETGIGRDACAPPLRCGNRLLFAAVARCDPQMRKNLQLQTSGILTTMTTPDEAPR